MERAEELVAALLLTAQPVVEAAEDDLRRRIAPDAEVTTHHATRTFLALFAFDDARPGSLWVGAVYDTVGVRAEMNSIVLNRDGVLRWHRE